MTQAAKAADGRDLEVLKALGRLELPKTRFWSGLRLAGRDDVEFRTLHGNRDALIIRDDNSFEGHARLYLFVTFEDDERDGTDQLPLGLWVRYEGHFDEKGKALIDDVRYRDEEAAEMLFG